MDLSDLDVALDATPEPPPVGPPPNWDPVAATEAVRKLTHAYPEHQNWLTEPSDEKRSCKYCEAQ